MFFCFFVSLFFPLLNEGGVLVTGDAEKAEILNTFFASVFASKTPPQDSWTLEGGERAWEVEISLLVDGLGVSEWAQHTHIHGY